MNTVCPQCGDPKRGAAERCWACSYQARRPQVGRGQAVPCRHCGLVEGAGGFYTGNVLRCRLCNVGLGYYLDFEAAQ